MRRRRAVAVLLLVIGALVALSLSTIVAGTEKAPARYAQISLGSHGLDVWRDSGTGELTFHVTTEKTSVATRYMPATFTLAELGDGKVLSTTRYPSGSAAWAKIHELYGVTQRQVRSALVAGSPSPAPPTANVG